MRYLIRKDSVPEEDAFSVTVWRGLYNYDTTPEEKKTTCRFPFTPDGKRRDLDWLNAQWESRKSEWETQ